MSAIPWSQNKNARQVYREYVDFWGFTYEGDTSDGHHVFRYPPTGQEVTLAHSPSAGWAWVQARRADAAKITGIQFRGKFQASRAKERAERERERRRATQERQQDALADAIARQQDARRRAYAERCVAARYRELQSIQQLMGARGSCL